MSASFCAFDHKDWAAHGLKDYEHFAEKVEYVSQREYGDGQLSGEWWHVGDETDRDGWRVIYYGSFGNDNSPGADSYTYAEAYDPSDDDDMAEYAKAVAKWEAAPEFIAVDDDGGDNGDE